MRLTLLAATPPPIRSSPGLILLALAGIGALHSIPLVSGPAGELTGLPPEKVTAWFVAVSSALLALRAVVAMTTRVILRPDGVLFATGILHRQRIFFPYERFQHVLLGQGMLERTVSVATVELARPSDLRSIEHGGTLPLRVRLDAAVAVAVFDEVSPRLSWRFAFREDREG